MLVSFKSFEMKPREMQQKEDQRFEEFLNLRSMQELRVTHDLVDTIMVDLVISKGLEVP